MDIKSLLKSIPTPSADDMAGRQKFARRYTLVFLREGSASRDDEARNERLHLEHLQHLTKLQLLGKLVLNGPTLNKHEIVGVSIYAAELDEARALAEADPKVKAGYLTVEAIPWIAVPSDIEAKMQNRGQVPVVNEPTLPFPTPEYSHAAPPPIRSGRQHGESD